MNERCQNRLTVLGAKPEVQRFQDSGWERHLRGRYLEPLEFSPRRFVCQFETDPHNLKRLQILSRRWPGLVLLLDFELTQRRIKGVAIARADELEHYKIHY